MQIENTKNQSEKKKIFKLTAPYPVHQYIFFGVALITTLFIVLRILMSMFTFPEFMEYSKDVDFYFLHENFQNGLFNFYELVDGFPPYYLYFWYFIFFPFGIIPVEISVYIWDILRLILVTWVIIKSSEKFKILTEKIIFYTLVTVGYFFDAWFNNVNFLILFFLFFSYHFLEQDKKWISGILFTLATFKINAFLFLIILLIVRKIKFKDLVYYLVPFALICIPYIIFPNYLFQMLNNWFMENPEFQGFNFLDALLWKFLQPSHLIFIALLYAIFFENLKESKMKKRLRIILLALLLIYYVYIIISAFFT